MRACAMQAAIMAEAITSHHMYTKQAAAALQQPGMMMLDGGGMRQAYGGSFQAYVSLRKQQAQQVTPR